MQQQGMTSVSSRCATSAITLSRQALIIRWWPIARAPRRKLTELSRRAAALDRAIAEHERQHGAFDLVFSICIKPIASSAAASGWPRIACGSAFTAFSPPPISATARALDRWLKQRKIANVYQGRNIVAVSRAVGDDLQQNLPIRPRRLAVINNPFDIDAIQQQAAAPCELAGGTIWCTSAAFTPPSGMTVC